MAALASDNIIIMGDLNARTASHQSVTHRSATAPLRSSSDSVLNSRGRHILQRLSEHDMLILNGAESKKLFTNPVSLAKLDH